MPVSCGGTDALCCADAGTPTPARVELQPATTRSVAVTTPTAMSVHSLNRRRLSLQILRCRRTVSIAFSLVRALGEPSLLCPLAQDASGPTMATAPRLFQQVLPDLPRCLACLFCLSCACLTFTLSDLAQIAAVYQLCRVMLSLSAIVLSSAVLESCWQGAIWIRGLRCRVRRWRDSLSRPWCPPTQIRSGRNAARNRDQPMCIPPSNRIYGKATITPCSTRISDGGARCGSCGRSVSGPGCHRCAQRCGGDRVIVHLSTLVARSACGLYDHPCRCYVSD